MNVPDDTNMNIASNPATIDRNGLIDWHERRLLIRISIQRFNYSGNSITVADADDPDRSVSFGPNSSGSDVSASLQRIMVSGLEQGDYLIVYWQH